MQEDHIQAMIDGLSKKWFEERAASQMTLGDLIGRVESLPSDFEVSAVSDPHSYRGYYTDLSFNPVDGKMKAGDLLDLLKSCLGEMFCGWKGGEYFMHKGTPVWLAKEGCCGMKIIDVNDDGTFELEADDV